MSEPTAEGTERPLLSVVVPFYGVEDYLEECLVSIRDQLLRDVEVVLVDDGSLDGSLSIAQSFVDADPRFHLVRQENAGLGPARNTGAAHAQGRYLTFVDSDDVVAPRGFFALVSALEETGSDFAAGNAKRFSRDRGSFQSWTHDGPFDHTHLRTTLAQRPDLIRDRMVWNKIYRRSFWDEKGFAFPAIRYEDYPVTLRAYLEASSVDILADHVYFWRAREAGTSITQQTEDARNAAERFASARLVMDVLHDHDAPAEVVTRVASYFARVDLVSLAGTMVRAPEAERAEVEAMAVELADVIAPEEATEQTQVSRLLHHALRDRDLPLARAVARWRTGGSNAALLREVGATRDPRAGIAVARAVIASKSPQTPLQPRRLRSTVTQAHWRHGVLTLVVETRLRPALAHRARIEAWSRENGLAWPASIQHVERTPWGVRTTIEAAEVTALRDAAPGLNAAIELRLTLPGRALRWAGTMTADPATLPGPTSGDTVVYLVTAAPDVSVTSIAADDVALVRAQAVDSPTSSPHFVLELPHEVTALRVRRPAPTADVEVPLDNRRAIIDPAQVLTDDVADDPISGFFERELEAHTPSGWVPVLLDGTTTSLTSSPGDRVELGPSAQGRAVIRRITVAPD